VGVSIVGPTDEVLLVTNRGQMLRTRVSEVRETGRNAQGVRLMNVDGDERIVAIETVEAEAEPVQADSLPPDSAGPTSSPPSGDLPPEA